MKSDQTPEEIMRDSVKAMHALIEHASTIAHVKRAFYNAYIGEGFTPQEALELIKRVIDF